MEPHKSVRIVAGVLMVIGALTSGVSGQDWPTGTPASVITVEAPGDVRASVGDLIGLPTTFPVIPGRMLSDLKADIRGDAVRFVTVASTPRTINGRPVMGAGVLTAFVVASKSGDSNVRVTPVKLDGQAGDVKEYRIRVTERAPTR